MDTQFPIRNALLRQLAPGDLDALQPLERLPLALRQSLEKAGTASPFVYFVEDGIASVVYDDATHGSTEVGIIGSEGATGLAAVYGDDRSPYDIFVQLDGSAMRCSREHLQLLMEQNPAARQTMLRFARAFSIQVTSTAIANARGKLEERLARWLLMVGDRADPTFHITHEFIALMLAVRRSGVTLALQSLESRGLIKASRGSVRIVDRDGLVAAAAGYYGRAEAEYARLLGPEK